MNPSASKLEQEHFFRKTFEIAKSATCSRSKCGSIIVKEGEVIGEGFNSPAGNLETQRRCTFEKSKLHRKVTDKTCCMHAETRAILDALRRNPTKLPGSRIYFVRLDSRSSEPIPSGAPYCTICSKLALDVGISEFTLWHTDGMKVYDVQEYNLLSYRFTDS